MNAMKAAHEVLKDRNHIPFTWKLAIERGEYRWAFAQALHCQMDKIRRLKALANETDTEAAELADLGSDAAHAALDASRHMPSFGPKSAASRQRAVAMRAFDILSARRQLAAC